MKNKKIIIFTIFIIVAVLSTIQPVFNLKIEEFKCKQATLTYMNEKNEKNKNVQYGYKNSSLAVNRERIEMILGEGYKYIAVKDGDCFAVIRHYDPNVDEYTYHIRSITREKHFAPNLFESDLDPSLRKSEESRKILQNDHEIFVENYNKFFK